MNTTTQTASSAPPRRSLSLWGIAEVFSIGFCLASVTGFLGRSWWLFELTSHFPVHYAIALVLFTAVWLVRRRWWLAVTCGTFAAFNAVLVASVAWAGGNSLVTSTNSLRLVAINVHTANERSDLVLDFLKSADADVILLMEVNSRWIADLAPLRTNYPHHVIEPRGDNFGIALFSRLPLTNENVLELGSAGVPSIAADITVGNRSVHLLGTHPLPPASREYARLRNEQLQEIASCARQHESLVVFGDLNVTPWSPFFRDLLRESGLKNTSRGRGLFASWPAGLPFGRIPLDHCLVSPSIQVIAKQLGPRVGGDHLPVVVELAIPSRE